MVKAWVGFVAVALATVSCGRLEVHHEWVVDPPPRADEAAQVIFDAYGMKSMPVVCWYGPEHLNCAGGYGWISQTGDCVSGEQEDGVVVLPLWDGMQFSVSAVGGIPEWVADMPHEFAHEASDQLGEGGCADHDCHWFARGGDGERVTLELARLGM